MIRMVLGVFIVVCGIINIPTDSGSGAMCVVFGITLALWGWYAWTKKKADYVSAVHDEIMGYAATALDPAACDTCTFEVTGVTHECRFSPLGRHRQDVMKEIRVGNQIYLKRYEWQGKPAFAVMSWKSNEDIGVAPRGCVRSLVRLEGKGVTSGIVVSTRNFEYNGDYFNNCEVRIDRIKR